jgi:DDE_Tnp_1-associated
MTSSPTAAARCQYLLHLLAQVPDPRKRRGRRHPLAGLLATGIAAVIAGSRSFAAIGQWAGDAGPVALAALGAERGPAEESTYRRAFALVSADVLDRVLGAWLHTRAVQAGGRLVIAIDGKTVRGAKSKAGKAPHLVAALAHGIGAVLGQVAADEKSNEIPAVRELLKAFADVAGAVCAIRSATVGTPRILVPGPCAFATSTARTGGGKYVPDDIRFQILYRLPFRSFSKPATDSPSTPGAPLFALTFSHASQTARLDIPNGLPGDFSSSTRLLPENFWLTGRTQPRTARLLRSALITRASALLRAGPPAHPATVLSPSRHQHRLERSLSPAPRQRAGQYRDTPSPVPRGSRRPGSRRLHAGHRLASQRTPARLIPR